MGTDPYIGEIGMFAGDYEPEGWFICDGRLLSIVNYQALYAVIGVRFGGDGRDNFALPDLRGRCPAGTGQGTGLTRRTIGDSGGSEGVQLFLDNMPAHAHPLGGKLGGAAAASLTALQDAGQTDNPSGSLIAAHTSAFSKNGATKVQMSAQAITVNTDGLSLPPATGAVGGNQAHQNMPPFLVINFLIAYLGIFPPRP